MIRRLLIVFVGGGSGAALRGLLIDWLPSWPGSLPLPILTANLLGAFVLGVLFVLADEVGLMRSQLRLFLAVGVLGGFTTFSTLAWNADTLLAGHDVAVALSYITVSVAGGLLAVVGGIALGREGVLTFERLVQAYLARVEGERARTAAAEERSIAVTDRTGTER